jgi:uncharacterized protein (DUF433 family)
VKRTVTVELLKDKHFPQVLAVAIDGIRITPNKASGSWDTVATWRRVRTSELLAAVGAGLADEEVQSW